MWRYLRKQSAITSAFPTTNIKVTAEKNCLFMLPSIKESNTPKHSLRNRTWLFIHLAGPGEKDKTPEIPFLCLVPLPGVWLLDIFLAMFTKPEHHILKVRNKSMNLNGLQSEHVIIRQRWFIQSILKDVLVGREQIMFVSAGKWWQSVINSSVIADK